MAAIAPSFNGTNQYSLTFLEYADKHSIEATTENFMQWDSSENENRELRAIEKEYGKEAIYARGIKALFAQRLYNSRLLRIVPSKDKPSPFKKGSIFRVSGIQKGIDITNMDNAEREYLVAVQIEKFKNAARKLAMYKLPLSKLQTLLEEAVGG